MFEFENLADLILIGDYLNNTLAIVEWTAIIIFLKKRIKKDSTSFLCNSYIAASESFRRKLSHLTDGMLICGSI